MSSNKDRVLIIDDEKQICLSLKGILEDEGYEVQYAFSPEAAEKLLSFGFSVVLLDVWFGKDSWDGVHFLDTIIREYRDVPIIVMSGHGTFDMAVRAIKKGAYDFIEKPFDVDKLLMSIKRVIEVGRLRKEKTEEFVEKDLYDLSFVFLEDSKPIGCVKEEISKAAAIDSRVLILGEVGTAKKEIARAVHNNSSRKSKRICFFSAASDSDAMNNILKKEPEPGGTLVACGVEHFSQKAQDSFLDFLEKRGALPGGNKIRVICAADGRKLEERLISRTFRRDLYDKLSSFVIKTVPLREMGSLIPSFAKHIADNYTKKIGIGDISFSSSAIMALSIFSWPGNFYSLINSVSYAVLSAYIRSRDEISVDDLPFEVRSTAEMFSDKSGSAQVIDLLSMPIAKARAVFEYRYIRAQIAAFSGNISSAANVIGMERSALHRKYASLKKKMEEA
ncbi:sigma-54-dependent transcriptional regulator [Candidatus Hydrogenosomobacter endosymbioticus]|uniref:Sigma-54-dependent Fis family transcriptional regulator n=1 Tax=Candidatus Hydrogenosomobacter endosymbioticus TaxID=2558174 RepID=A0ABN6L3C4_9PROT|nr:response regulator [Candidatus Hydrogenosomobacter endosymbioticus]BDB96371.1 sigma-54-dependent Fis family transcriptional regulator [Candidatus Hydrogenosomobacter endosymbioticus]